MTLDSRFVFGLQQVCHGFSLFFGTQCGCLCGPAGYGLEFQCAEDGFQIVHSMLHLLGYDHEAGGLEAVRMREKEEAVLIQLGLPRTVSYTSDEI